MKKFFTHDDPVVAVHRPRVLVETAVAQGAERAALFAGTGITQSMLELPETSPPLQCADGLLEQVRRLLDAGRGRPLRLRELARELQTSSRTLNRELQGIGTSYRRLLDDSRRMRAVEWVRGSDMTTVQIASELGFSDVRGFRRAFKRWTGELPTSMRARARA